MFCLLDLPSCLSKSQQRGMAARSPTRSPRDRTSDVVIYGSQQLLWLLLLFSATLPLQYNYNSVRTRLWTLHNEAQVSQSHIPGHAVDNVCITRTLSVCPCRPWHHPQRLGSAKSTHGHHLLFGSWSSECDGDYHICRAHS